jgi:hypothetical protein
MFAAVTAMPPIGTTRIRRTVPAVRAPAR